MNGNSNYSDANFHLKVALFSLSLIYISPIHSRDFDFSEKSFLHKLLHYSFKISSLPLLVLVHEIFIQQGFKFPVIESDLIKLIDSSGGQEGVGEYNVK